MGTGEYDSNHTGDQAGADTASVLGEDVGLGFGLAPERNRISLSLCSSKLRVAIIIANGNSV